jgi:DNA mismatch endonuclease (patch repair protein)
VPDVFTKKKRSEVMATIRARGNKETELVLMGIFRRNKITGWRRHALLKFGVRSAEGGVGKLKKTSRGRKAQRLKAESAIRNPQSAISPGVRPDFVFPRERVAVFVDGCFWHGCPKHFRMPVGNRSCWRKKMSGNRARDRLVNRRLRASGWRVVRIWEHELANEGKVVGKISHRLH